MIYIIIVLAVIARFIPHMPNFAPITALAIFSAANMDWKKSVGLVLAVRFISDIFLGFFSWPLMLAVYASHLVGILFGLWIKNSSHPVPSSDGTPLLGRRGISAVNLRYSAELSSFSGRSTPRSGGRWLEHSTKIIISSLGASAVFFLATNFAFLYADYPHTLSGIMLAYYNGLPFLRGTVLGDMGYSVALFGSYAIALSLLNTNKYQYTNVVKQYSYISKN
jgi:hypothetical protein